MAIIISDGKVLTQIAMSGTRSKVKERANAHCARFKGYSNKVFAAHYGAYGKIRLDFTSDYEPEQGYDLNDDYDSPADSSCLEMPSYTS